MSISARCTRSRRLSGSGLRDRRSDFYRHLRRKPAKIRFIQSPFTKYILIAGGVLLILLPAFQA